MRWLVTGGCGFVGSNVADSLLADGEDVVILDNLFRFGSSSNLEWLRSRHGDGWRFAQADVRDDGVVDALVAEFRPDVVVHLAGQVAMTTSLADPRLDFTVNALGTFNVLDAVRRLSPDSGVIYSSTNKVYGSLDQIRLVEAETRWTAPDFPDGFDESLQLDGHSPYGCSKLSGDQYVRDFHRMFGLRTAVFRHSSMYGGRQFATYDQGWVGWFCQKAVEQSGGAAEPFTISGDGKQVRDVLHARDLVALFRGAGASLDSIAGRIFNIGGGMPNSLSLLELFAILEEQTGSAMHYERLAERAGDQRVFVADNSAITDAIGWAPQVGAREGVADALEWTRRLLGE